MTTEFEEEACPLVTEYTRKLGLSDKTMELLYRVREHDPEEGPIPITIPPTIRKVTKSGKPFSPRNYQTQSIAHMIKMFRYMDGHAVGLGKAQPLTSKVLTPSGWVLMQELRIGDEVIDPDGGIGIVEGIFPQGVKESYTLTCMDGSSTECCDEHLWHVYTMEDKVRGTDGRVMTTRNLMDKKLFEMNGQWRRSKFFLPLTQPVLFQEKETLLITPYIMGALLGDGGLTTGSVILTSADEEILNRVRLELPNNLTLNHADRYSYRISRGNSPKNKNGVKKALVTYNLMGKKSFEKSVPTDYLRSSIPDRMALLQGLLDTDGECSKSGLVYFHTSSLQLAKDVAELVRSLGGISNVSKPKARFYTYKGEKRQGLDSYYVSIKTHFNPFFLSRKAEKWKPQLLAKAIDKIEPNGKLVEMQCIRVSTKRHLYITDDYIVTHNTICAITASAYLLNKKPGMKVIILGTKSTTYQWKSEYENFSTLNAEVLQDKYEGKKGSDARLAQIEDFLKSDDQDVLIAKYTSLIGRRRVLEGEFDAEGNPISEGQREEVSPEVLALVGILKKYGSNVILILDECQKFKSTTSQIRKMLLKIQPHIAIIWAMTATIIQNSLEEFYSISVAIGIRPLGNMKQFRENHCIYKMVHVGRGINKPQLVGYKNVKTFKLEMRPFYYGRSQAQVKEPLPKLSTTYHPVDLDKTQVKLLDDIKSKKFVLPPIVKKNANGEVYEKERDPDNMMTMLAVTQMIANNYNLLYKDEKDKFLSKALSPKEEMLQDLLEGELAGEKVIVFTKFRSWIDRFEGLCKAGHFTDRKFLRITGAESEKEREENKQKFQNDPSHDLLFINTAAAEGVNLQQAAHMILLDVPWSWGVLIQLVGRMVRMASPHSACTLHVLPAKGTIDEYAIDTLKGKGELFETILGESYSAGLLNDANDLDLASGMDKMNDDAEFLKLLKAHVKVVKMGAFIDGTQIKEAQRDSDYVMAFEEKAKKPAKKRVSISDADFSKWEF